MKDYGETISLNTFTCKTGDGEQWEDGDVSGLLWGWKGVELTRDRTVAGVIIGGA